MNEWTNESKPEWPQRGSKAKIYSPLATRKDLCCCSLGVSVWGRGAPAGSSQGRPLSGWLAGPWPPSSLRGRGPVSVAEKAGPRGGAPAPGEGLRSRLRPARVSSRGLGWREGAGLPGRRDGAGVSAIDRTGRCREAFRPASASRRGGGAGVVAEVWAFPPLPGDGWGLPLLPPRPAQSPARPVGSGAQIGIPLLTPLPSHRGRHHLPRTLLRHYFHPAGSAACVLGTCAGPGPAAHQRLELFHQKVSEESQPSHPHPYPKHYSDFYLCGLV